MAVVEINKANMKRSSMTILGCDFGSRISDSCVRFGLPFWHSVQREVSTNSRNRSGLANLESAILEVCIRKILTECTGLLVQYDDATGASTVLERICELFCT